ncbi:MAG: hypothetical protein LM577_01165 [Thermoproteaceae archaeon]|jgi:DNA-binding MarR family transcriptional regulator|nr:hypothetical protein [Thermoproteaceae archaeon]
MRKIGVCERALARLLLAIYKFHAAHGRWPYMRELLRQLGEWGYGQDALEEAVRRGLVERYEGRCHARRPCVYNRLTDRGLAVVQALELA